MCSDIDIHYSKEDLSNIFVFKTRTTTSKTQCSDCRHGLLHLPTEIQEFSGFISSAISLFDDI